MVHNNAPAGNRTGFFFYNAFPKKNASHICVDWILLYLHLIMEQNIVKFKCSEKLSYHHTLVF